MENVHVVPTWGKGGGVGQEKGQNGRQAMIEQLLQKPGSKPKKEEDSC